LFGKFPKLFELFMSQETEISESKTQTFYDSIADVHHLAMKVNGYRSSVANYLQSLDLQLNENSLVLDAGSGTGIVTLGFQTAGFRPKKCVALDLSFNSLDVSREQFERDEKADAENIALVQGNVVEMPFDEETFDLILTCGVLEYVALEDGLKEFARVLKTGAKLVLIPVKPSLVGAVLEILYNFKIHSIEETEEIAARYFKIVGEHEFPITEPMGWSKMIFLLEKK
jgi:ubiquinone/menaquinone biosynthesis C-methylase UbiE